MWPIRGRATGQGMVFGLSVCPEQGIHYIILGESHCLSLKGSESVLNRVRLHHCHY